MNLQIRQEIPADYSGVYELVTAAFLNAEHTDGDEQNLVERLRKSASFIPELSLVAEMDGKLAGHLLFTKITVGEKAALALAPLAVAPEFQGMGVGGKLIAEGHRIAKALGYGFSILLGHAAYYPRFGYQPASRFGIVSPFPVPDEAFMALDLQDSGQRLEGTVAYDPAFFPQN